MASSILKKHLWGITGYFSGVLGVGTPYVWRSGTPMPYRKNHAQKKSAVRTIKITKKKGHNKIVKEIYWVCTTASQEAKSRNKAKKFGEILFFGY